MQRKSNKLETADELRKAREEMAALRLEITLLVHQLNQHIRSIREELNLESPRLQ